MQASVLFVEGSTFSVFAGRDGGLGFFSSCMWLKSGSLLHDSPSVLEAETNWLYISPCDISDQLHGSRSDHGHPAAFEPRSADFEPWALQPKSSTGAFSGLETHLHLKAVRYKRRKHVAVLPGLPRGPASASGFRCLTVFRSLASKILHEPKPDPKSGLSRTLSAASAGEGQPRSALEFCDQFSKKAVTAASYWPDNAPEARGGPRRRTEALRRQRTPCC